jgi:hypothetical protein
LSQKAVSHIKRMRGGSQAQLFRCANNALYVVKLLGNPQGSKVLFNDYMGSKLAAAAGLPTAEVDQIEVGPELTEGSPGLYFQTERENRPCSAGIHFGSRFVAPLYVGTVLDHVPVEFFRRVRNADSIPAAIAFDKWTGNCDGRQVVFWKLARQRLYSATLIDFGYCFGAGHWSFRDSPLAGAYMQDCYDSVTGWESFEPYLSRIEQMDVNVIHRILREIPSEWYEGDVLGAQQIVDMLIKRRLRVREMILGFKNSTRNPFPNWRMTNIYRPVSATTGLSLG